jgi:hypothetical protein
MIKSFIISHVPNDTNSITIEQSAQIPNYYAQEIEIQSPGVLMNIDESVYETILKLSKKLCLNGVLSFNILDMKDLAKHYLSGAVEETEFLNIIEDNKGFSFDISYFISVLKSNTDITLKNINKEQFILNITIERIAV